MSFTVTVKRNKRVDLSKVQTSLRGPKKVKVGLPSGEADSDVIMRGVWTHFGTRGGASGGGWGGVVPERPWLTSTMRDNRSKYRDGMKASAKKLLLGQTSLQTVLSKLGILAQGDIQESISTWTTPGNSEATIAIKGSSQPLIDSSEMRNSVTYLIGNF